MKITSKMVAGAFIIAIMVLSVFGFVLSYATNSTNTLEFNEIQFRQTQYGWDAKVGGKNRQFLYHPLEISHLTIPDATALDARSIAITYNGESPDTETLAQAQFYIEQTSGDVRAIVRGISTPGTALPTITCADATASQPVVYLDIGNETNVRMDEQCLMITGSDPLTLVQYAELINYHILGVYNG